MKKVLLVGTGDVGKHILEFVARDEVKREEMLKKSNGKRTIPQIFIEDFHVGGYVELRALEKKGELLNLVK